MTIRSMNPIVRHLRKAALVDQRKTLSDARLIESFLACRDQAAFEVLVKRHGAMVLGVCKRVIGNLHDAEDAFQAVFLVLARKASSVLPRELVGNWLYGVAYRTALQARHRLQRHQARQRQVNDMPIPHTAPGHELAELHEALDLELSRLPEKYRAPIILCDLEGRSRRDVAVQLKIPEGTLSSRLATGRQTLARRLARHGVTLPGGAVASAMTRQAMAAALSPALVNSTAKAACVVAAGESAAAIVSAPVLALSQGVLKTMFLNKLKVISLLFFGILLGGFGMGLIGLPGNDGSPPVHAAMPPPAGQVANDEPLHLVALVDSGTVERQPETEPLEGGLLLEPEVQIELRLSNSQIERFKKVAKDADARTKTKHDEIQQIRKQIEELQTKIRKIQGGIERERSQAIGKIAPEVLSGKSVQRLREIQRQLRGLPNLLQDTHVQRLLKLNDEQLRKVEDILKKKKTAAPRLHDRIVSRVLLSDWYLSVHGTRSYSDEVDAVKVYYDRPVTFWAGALHDPKIDRSLLDVLSQSQKQALLQWVGEPFQSSAWQELREYGMKGK